MLIILKASQKDLKIKNKKSLPTTNTQKYLPPKPYVFKHPSTNDMPFPNPKHVKIIHDIAA